MNNQPYSQQSIASLTLLELEALVANIAKKTVREEIISIQKIDRKLFAETFGAWEDDKTEQETIEQIYDSRT
jgi:hypothetical protein